MTATTGIWNREMTGSHSAGVTAMDSSTDSSSNGSTNDAATISSNDFLTLLVTEMQNQDPTATTDPNEYINQLVNVNSLEQLISINQTLSSALDSSSSASSSSGASGAESNAMHSNSDVATSPAFAAAGTTPGYDAVGSSMLQNTNQHRIGGNLSAPGTSASAQRVAKSLGGVS
jgi:flagellar basal-body rod modification protein FlgD